MNTTQHISQEYNEELENIKSQVLAMGGLVEEQFQDASTVLLKGKIDLTTKILKLGQQVNKVELTIDEECAQIIARRQPTAVDLRTLLSAIKMATDLERIGDESEKIASFASELSTNAKSMDFYKLLKSLVTVASGMLSGALDSYARLDTQKALEVCELDQDLDIEFEKLNRVLTTYLLEDQKNIENNLKVIWCARSLERIGDHAKNLCEHVVYIVQGKDIRYTHSKPTIK